MKPLVIYHANCTDGYGAAFAAWLKLGDEAEYLPMNYGNDYALSENTFEFKDREVYILDFSFPREVMEMFFTRAKRVVWLDHHKTAFEMWCGKEKGQHYETESDHYIVLDNYKSGALLAWEYFYPNTEVPMLIKHIDDRDRWQWVLEGSAEIHAALGSMQPWSFEQWNTLIMDRTEVDSADGLQGKSAFIAEGAAILRAQDQNIARMAKQARKCAIPCTTNDGSQSAFPGLAVNTPIHQSEVGHELANQSGTYGLVWYVADNGRVRCSLRSNGDYDVSSIARSFDGGGHRNAAGFETNIETLMGWLSC